MAISKRSRMKINKKRERERKGEEQEGIYINEREKLINERVVNLREREKRREREREKRRIKKQATPLTNQ